jgi:glutathione S-transferase
MAPVLGYWNIRSITQPIRLLLAYTNTAYEEKSYLYGDDPTDPRINSEWRLKHKNNLGLDFPNIPYYIDGDTKITQSGAILRYVARKNNLVGTTSEEQTRVDLIEYELTDLRNAYTVVCYTPKPQYDVGKASYEKELPGKLELFSKFLGKNPYFAGKNITYVDFMLYEFFDQQKVFVPGCLDKFSNLLEFHKRIESIPSVAAYLSSDVHKARKDAFNGKSATFMPTKA